MPLPRALPDSPYRLGVLVVAGVTLIVRASTASRWSWTNDDWFYLHDAATMGLWRYLTQDYNGHLMPGGFLLTWMFTKVAPLNFWLPVLFVAFSSAATVLIWGAALGRIAGERVATLWPLAIVSLSAVYVRPTVWWAAATQSLSMLAFMGLGALYADRWRHTRSRRDLAMLLVVYAAALLFWQKAVLLSLPIAAVVVGVSGMPLPERIARAKAPLLGVLAITCLYIPAYLVRTRGTSSNNSIEFDASAIGGGGFEAIARAFSEVLSPALLGGPWGTLPVNGNPYAHPPLLQSVVLAGLVISAVLVTVARRRHTWLPITMAVLYALVAWGMILLSNRFLSLREATLTDERFNADVLAAAVVALALVMGSVPVGRPTDPGAGVRDTGGTRRATAALLCLAGSLLVANVSQVRRLAEQPDRGWTTAILSDLSETDTPVTLWDANTPSTVLHPGYYPDQARLSYALAPLEADVSFREVAERLTMVDDRGRLRGVAVSPTSESREGPVDGCGYSVGGGDSVDVPVTSSLFYWDWALQVNAFAGESSTLDVGVGDSTTRIPIRPGLRQYQAQIAAEVKSHVTITSPPGSPTVCVTEVLIGNVEPVDD